MLDTIFPISSRPASLGQLALDVDRLFEMTSRMGSMLSSQGRMEWPGLNAWQDGDEIVVESEIPGFTIDDIEVDVSDDTVIIRGQREQHTPEGASTIRRERSTTRFERSLRLPSPVEHDQAQATLTNGVLQVRMPIAQSARPRRIAVKVGSQARIERKEQGALPGSNRKRESEPASTHD